MDAAEVVMAHKKIIGLKLVPSVVYMYIIQWSAALSLTLCHQLEFLPMRTSC